MASAVKTPFELPVNEMHWNSSEPPVEKKVKLK